MQNKIVCDNLDDDLEDALESCDSLRGPHSDDQRKINSDATGPPALFPLIGTRDNNDSKSAASK